MVASNLLLGNNRVVGREGEGKVGFSYLKGKEHVHH
jgi:hypothetical protein